MGVKKIIASLRRKIRKRQVLRSVLSRKQQNTHVLNIHRKDTHNVGDWYCAPHHYFNELKGTGRDIFDYKKDDRAITDKFITEVSENALIIGGGGLLNRGGFRRQMKAFEQLGPRGKKTVLWGVGHNEKDPKTFGKVTEYNVDVTKFGIVGTRDYSMPGDYVPCVSCMHPIFDNTVEVNQETGIIFHKDTVKKPHIVKKFEGLPTTSNTTNFEELIHFIGRSEHIVTDSYHAMYWSMLLGKKVAVVPNSSKFYDFHKEAVITTFDNALKEVKNCSIYPGLLEECRNINIEFSKKVFDYLNV